MTCRRGFPDEWNHQYECIKSVASEEYPSPASLFDLIENCFFVIADDCKVLDVPINDPIDPIFDELNALHHIVTGGTDILREMVFINPVYPNILDIWKRMRILYSEALERIQKMQILPLP